MLVKKISFIRPTLLNDIEDHNIDVFVELEDGYTHTVVVATCKNILSLMDKEKIRRFDKKSFDFEVEIFMKHNLLVRIWF